VVALSLLLASPSFAQSGDGRTIPGGDAGALSRAELSRAVAIQAGSSPSPATQPGPALTPLTFEAAVSRAVEQNRTIQLAAANVLRAEAILQQVRASTLPFATAAITNTTLDGARGFDGLITQPQNQSRLSASIGMPVLAASQWALRAQQMDRVEVARLNTADVRRQISIATATAYLAIIAQKRRVDVQLRALETSRAQLDYNQKRLEGGIGSRLNALRASQIVSSDRSLLEVAQLNVRLAQEALGILLNEDAPVDTAGEPAFEIPVIGEPSQWLPLRTDIRLFTADRDLSQRIVEDSSKDWWPTGVVSFDPQFLTPSGLFQPSRTWSITLSVQQQVYDGGQRRGLRRQREADLQASEASLEQLELQAKAEVRTARAAVEFQQRALTSARAAADAANEALKITIVAFDAGASTNIEVIDAQRSARDLETAVAQAEDRVRQARLDLLVALGRFPASP
jgi:outer membrane protein TolC